MLAFLSNVFPVIGCKDHSVEEVFFYTVNDYHTLGMFHPRENRGTNAGRCSIQASPVCFAPKMPVKRVA